MIKSYKQEANISRIYSDSAPLNASLGIRFAEKFVMQKKFKGWKPGKQPHGCKAQQLSIRLFLFSPGNQ